MNPWILSGAGIGALVVGVAVIGMGIERPPIDSAQIGYRGLGMEVNVNPRTWDATVARNQAPAPEPPIDPSGQKSSEVYENVQVLGDLDSNEFLRLMTAITAWVSPDTGVPGQGCAYCHADGEELSSDSLYTKIVSRRMLQMTAHINAQWQSHVGATGATCYTCHRGRNVPEQIWFADPGPVQPLGVVGNRAGQNYPAPVAAMASLPFDPLAPFLAADPASIRVISQTVLPEGNRASIKQTEWTYSLMMHMSEALGVNCTFCHNSRSFTSWDSSPPTRANAWYGIRMVRDLNQAYLEPLGPQYPANRLGPTGDAPKANCATCHIGVSKPLLGVSMAKDYPELGVVTP
jgi:photosynthetic reaction center cytochrome c subunit